MFRFENLNIYKEAIVLSKDIYQTTKIWPKEELFGLTNQIRRASFSIALNIAEGTSRSKKEFAHFLDMASGSCFEVVACLEIAQLNNYIDEKTHLDFYNRASKLSMMIGALKKNL